MLGDTMQQTSMFFFITIRRPQRPTLFPYTTLFRSGVGPDRPGEARTLARREHLHGVGQRARRRNDEAPRHGDGHVEIAVLEEELALAEVLLGVPTAHVVAHRDPRVPLRHLVQPATGALLTPHAV